MKTLFILLIIALFLNGCKSPKRNEVDNQAKTHIEIHADTLSSPVSANRAVPKKLVVGIKELDIFFYDWPENFTLNYQGYSLDDDNSAGSSQFVIRHNYSKVCDISVKLWNHAESLATGESPYTVGKIPAYRTVSPNGNLSYSFETDGEGFGSIVSVTELDPTFENWFTGSFSSTMNEQTDSLLSLVSSPFPLQAPQSIQKIGISFRTEPYDDGSFPRTKVWMRLTNFSNLMTNTKMIADVIGPVENTTDGKPTLNEGEELVLKNHYAGLSKQWVLANEGSRLVLYEKTEDEPSMETEGETTLQSKEILVLPVEEYNFSFVGYFPMGE